MSHVLKWKAQPAARPPARGARTGRPPEGLNILMLAPTGFFSDYGCHVRILEEARALSARGHHIRIFTYHAGRDLPRLDVTRIPRLPWGGRYSMGSSWHKPFFDALLLARAFLAHRTRPPDLIHAFLHEGALIGSVLARLWHAPLVFDYQGSLTGEMADHGFLRPGSPLYGSMRRLERAIDDLPRAIVTSSAHAARLLREGGCRCPIIRTVPDCVDAWQFRAPPPDRVNALRARLGLPAGSPVVGYLGKLAPYQGTDLLLEAAARLRLRRPDVHFLVMGYPDVDRYRARARALGLDGAVTFTGRIPYPAAADYLALSDVAVAPKLSETESNGKLLNYMALGLPVVAFDTPVAREYLQDLGRFSAPTSADLAVALEQALADPRDGALGLRLRKRAMDVFSLDHSGDRIEAVYGMVLDQASEVAWAADGGG